MPRALTTAEPDEAGWRFKWDEHPSLFFGKDTRIDFRLRLQTHVRSSGADIGGDEGVDLAHRRIGVEGTIKDVLDFEIERELEDDDPWRDVFVNYRRFPAAEVRAGKFKLPFSLDENTSATNLDFIYRSMAAEALAPGRDRGVMAHGRLLRKMMRYEIGWFANDGSNAANQNPEEVFGDRTIAGRVSVQPFRRHRTLLKDLQLGAAFTDSQVAAGIPAIDGDTALNATFFDSEVWVNGRRRRQGLELRWRPGPASVKAEYLRVSTERLGQSVEDTDLEPLVGSGWYVSGTWALTGETKADDLTVPRRPLFRGGWGAIEVAARVEALSFGSLDGGDAASTSPRAEVVLGNRDRASTVGVNWYPVRHVKVQMNVIRERITDPSRGPAPDAPSFWSQVLRFQLDL